ncbi:hypothetical protein [Campylobacter corcagiensis]|nr:hypothetical protein [Campylobacter corcagiensis]
MIKSLFLLITWFLLIYFSWKFIKLNIDHIEEHEDRFFTKD